MRLVVFGAGAVGGVIAGRVFEHGNEVVAIARGAHFKAMRDRGMRLVDPDRTVTLSIPVVDHPGRIEWRADDVVLVTTKTQDSTGAMGTLAAAAGPDVPVVCVQNGVENERIATRRFAHVYGICVMLPAEHLEPGVSLRRRRPSAVCSTSAAIRRVSTMSRTRSPPCCRPRPSNRSRVRMSCVGSTASSS